MRLVLLLAAIQFTFVLDFMIIMPLGPQLMTLFDLSAVRLGLLNHGVRVKTPIGGSSLVLSDSMSAQQAFFSSESSMNLKRQ